MLEVLQSALISFMKPETAFGKSFRDAVLAGVTAFLTVFSEFDFGMVTPMVSAVIMFLLAQINRFLRPTFPAPSQT